jgi:hypothetical protein
VAYQAQQIIEEGNVNLPAVSHQKPLSVVLDSFWPNSFCTARNYAAEVSAGSAFGPRPIIPR